jgi:hypothetical protein
MRWVWIAVVCLSGCAATARNLCKQSCFEQQDRCLKSSQGAAGTACDQDFSACLSHCS